jgi:hypothetical protein
VAGQTGNKVYSSFESQVTFPGDTANGVPATSSWLMYNRSVAGGPVELVRQTISVTAGKVYRFVMYGSNELNVTTSADDPMIQFAINGAGVGPVFREYDHNDPAGGDGGVDRWHRRTYDWTATTTGTVAFGVLNNQTTGNGNALALTQMSVKEILSC